MRENPCENTGGRLAGHERFLWEQIVNNFLEEN
jgi:hypothetical protein